MMILRGNGIPEVIVRAERDKNSGITVSLRELADRDALKEIARTGHLINSQKESPPEVNSKIDKAIWSHMQSRAGVSEK